MTLQSALCGRLRNVSPMRPAVPLVTALLVVAAVSGTVVAPAAATPSPAESGDTRPVATDARADETTPYNGTGPNVSRVLTLPRSAVDATNVTAVEVDAGGTTTVAADAAAIRIRTDALVTRLDAADGDERRGLLRRAAGRLTARTATLQGHQSAAISAYNGGEMTARELLVELARVDRTARLLERRAVLLQNATQAAFSSDAPLVDNVTETRFGLRRFQGPVREQVAAAAGGRVDGSRVFVATTERGVTLSTVVNDTYVREVYRGFLWSSGGRGLSVTEASAATAEAYPEIWAARNRTSGAGSNASFVLRVTHPGGTLDSHVRGENRRVFRAVQRLRLSKYPPGPGVGRQLNGLVMRVNRTYPGGPLRVSVADAQTGEPVNTSVSVTPIGRPDIAEVGVTGGDGVLWTLGPGETPQGYTVTADETDSSRVVIVVTNSSRATTVAQARRG